MLMAFCIHMLLYLAELRHELLFVAEPGLTVEQDWRVDGIYQHCVLEFYHVSVPSKWSGHPCHHSTHIKTSSALTRKQAAESRDLTR